MTHSINLQTLVKFPTRPPLQKKTIRCRKLKGLNPEVLRKAVAKTSLCSSPEDGLEALVTQYQEHLNKVLDSVAPVQTKSFVERPLIPWINNDILNCKNDILNCKRHKQKLEKLWRKKKLTVYHDMYVAEKQKLQNIIKAAKTQHYKGKIREFSGDQGQLFRFIAHLQNTKGNPIPPEHNDKLELCTKFNNFFITKISGIRSKLNNSTLLIHGSGSHAGNLHTASPTIFTKQKLTNWKPVSEEQVAKLIQNSSKASYKNDTLPTKLLKDYLQEQLIPTFVTLLSALWKMAFSQNTIRLHL